MNIRESIREILIEDNRMRGVIRHLVRDVVEVFKNEDEGEFYLPEYFEDRDEMLYEFDGLYPFTMEIYLEHGEYGVNAEYAREDEIFLIKIRYNPEDKKTILYKLVGELNEIIAHELTHLKQKIKKTFNLDVDEPETSIEYYTQPHEIDAQYYGFKRLSKLTRKPFKDVVKNWFDTHKELHKLKDNEIEIVVDKILNYKNERNI